MNSQAIAKKMGIPDENINVLNGDTATVTKIDETLEMIYKKIQNTCVDSE